MLIGILLIIAVHVGWIVVFESATLWGATIIAGVVFACTARWG